MKTWLRYLFINGTFALSLYLAMVHFNEVATVAALGFAWYAILGGLLAAFFLRFYPWMLISQIKDVDRRRMAIPAWLDNLFDVGVLAALAWNGWWVTFTAYLVHPFCVQYVHRAFKRALA